MSATYAPELLSVIERSIEAHPRSQQKMIGPSEIGNPCDIAVLHKLNGDEEPRRGSSGWKPAVGTAVHAQLEEWFGTENQRLGRVRWLTEKRVTVGEVGGLPVSGTCDLFDVDTGTVIDWKCVGPQMLLNYKAKGPSERYRIQAHLYGLGYVREVNTALPTTVAIAFLPRDGELDRTYVWSEPFSPVTALTALKRLERLWNLLQDEGIEAIDGMDGCTDKWCSWCRTAPSVRTGGTFFDPSYQQGAA